MSALVVNADARDLSFLAAESVDLVVTSPPYWAQRSYREDGEHYEGQIGSESHPRLWLEAMWECAREWWRVLKPSGSVFVNLGDKRAGSGGHNNSGLAHGKEVSSNGIGPAASRRNAPDRYQQAHFGRVKSRQLLPERFAIGMEDGLGDPEGLGWIVRQVIVWEKLNGLPESVTDRTRDNFEVVYHFTKSERYYSAVNEIREPASDYERRNGAARATPNGRRPRAFADTCNPLGKLPGSVWRIASEPLRIPMHFVEDDRGWRVFGNPAGSEKAKRKERELLWAYFEQRAREGCQWGRYGDVRHFAAFGTELVRPLILGWSPPAICLRCGEGRRPVVAKSLRHKQYVTPEHRERMAAGVATGRSGRTDYYDELGSTEATIVGYACACTPFTDHPGSKGGGWGSYDGDRSGGPAANGKQHVPANYAERRGPWREWHLDGWTPPPSRSAVVLDPFAGTGTTLGVAQALGRNAVGVELSEDYCRLARWRMSQPLQWAKATARCWAEAQGTLL